MLRLGCELAFSLPEEIPLVAMLRVHASRAGALQSPDVLRTEPGVPVTTYLDAYGNTCSRLLAPKGRLVLRTDTVIVDDGAADPVAPEARQHAVGELPDEALIYLLASRYCETDLLSDYAWRTFGGTPEGWPRVQAICDHVHEIVRFGYENADSAQTAAQTLERRRGVCRDFAHLAIALCRSMNIPARYCTGYVSDVGQPPPYPPMDFAAWMEVYLSHRWWVFDPRNHTPRRGRVLVARGRDATDVPLTLSFGTAILERFGVVTEEV